MLLHKTVLVNESINYLVTDHRGVYVDCTAGGGGHLREIFEFTKGQARLIGIDKDAFALDQARAKLGDAAELFHNDFAELSLVLKTANVNQVDGIIADLGISSFQIDDKQRGFSYDEDGPLDMRMNTDEYLDAKTIVNEYAEEELKQIIRDYGEERFASRIAGAIVRYRKEKEISTTKQLVSIIISAIPSRYKYDKHPARRTFQALRIAVNRELNAISLMLPQALAALKTGGRLVIISFHSLEDRIVKQFIHYHALDCICDPKGPICTCGHRAQLKVLTRKPVVPTEEEITANTRARSAKLRVAMKL